ncbi:major facilitator superfamily domain-containing protein [Phaeosphaeriaceae sp. PMI808]|nr:major facilitator superfamily domain-containing protein [Phaeosphaeriaceae sp. PMI808]
MNEPINVANYDHEHQRKPTSGPTHPKKWSDKKKWVHVLIVASMTMATPLGSTIHAPALQKVADDFSVETSTASLTIQAYVIGFSIAPFLFLPLSKLYGRLYIYHAANLLLLLGHIGCALAPGFGWLLGFRFLAGCAGACAITQGSGTIADLIEKERRGRAVALMAFGTVWAPTVGPMVGGRITESFSWRGCFWVLVGVVAFNSIIAGLYMDETSTIHIAHAYQTLPDQEPKSPLTSNFAHDLDEKKQSEANPLKWFVISAIFAPFQLLRYSLFSAVALLSASFYSTQIYLYIDIPATYKAEYGFTPSQTGLAFLGTGIGMTVGLLAFGIFSDRIMVMLAGNGKTQPEHRLPLMLVSAILVSSGLVVYGLAARPEVHWTFPILGNGLTGAGLYSMSMGAATYLIDVSPQRAAESATLMSVVRFPIGALVSALGARLVHLTGRTAIHGMFAIFALHAVPVVYLLYRHGASLRARYCLD